MMIARVKRLQTNLTYQNLENSCFYIDAIMVDQI